MINFSYQLSAISYQLSAISYQLSAISYQLSAISYQLSATNCYNKLFSYQLSAATNCYNNIPAIVAVVQLARAPPIMAFKATFASAFLRPGATAPIPPN